MDAPAFRFAIFSRNLSQESSKTHRFHRRDLELVITSSIDGKSDKGRKGFSLKLRINERKAETGDEPRIPDDERLRERNRRPRPCPTTDWLRNHRRRVSSTPPPTNVTRIFEWNIRYLILMCVCVCARERSPFQCVSAWFRDYHPHWDTACSRHIVLVDLTVEVEVANRRPFKLDPTIDDVIWFSSVRSGAWNLFTEHIRYCSKCPLWTHSRISPFSNNIMIR